MGRTKRACALVLSALLCVLIGCGQAKEENVQQKAQPVTYENAMKELQQQVTEDTISCWYTGDSDKGYLESAAAAFEKEYGIKVKLVYYDGVSLFEDMNQANQQENGPEVYLMGNDQLEYAKTAGVVEQNTVFDDTFWKEN